MDVLGADRAAWLHNLLTNDIKRLTPGHGCLAAFLTPRAKVQGVVQIFAQPDSYRLEYDALRAASLPTALLKYRISERVELRDRARDLGLLWLQGPSAPTILDVWAGPGLVGPQEFDHADHRIDEHPVTIARRSMTGDPGFLIFAPAEHLNHVRDRLLAIGAPLGLILCSMDTWDSLRLEAGIPRDGVDITERDLLSETGLTQAISTTKGCYLGQEFVVRIRDQGQVTRQLSLLALEGSVPAPAGAIIRASDPSTPRLRSGQAPLGTNRDIGIITSSAFVPTQQRAFAMGYLHRDACHPGAIVTVVAPDGPIGGAVIEKKSRF